MKVRELIEELRQFDEDTEVVVSDFRDDYVYQALVDWVDVTDGSSSYYDQRVEDGAEYVIIGSDWGAQERSRRK